MRRAPLTASIHVAVSIASFTSSHISSLGAGSALARVSSDAETRVGSETVKARQGSVVDGADKPASPSTKQLQDALLKLATPETQPSKAEMCETLASAAQQQALPLGFFVRLIQQESDFDPKAVSPVGAQGVAQFMPQTAQEWGLDDPFEPHQALRAAARFLHALHDQLGNWGLAAAAYNAGPGRIQKWLDQKASLPEETQHYVLTITGVPAEKWKGGMRKTDFTIPPQAPCQEYARLAGIAIAEADIPLPRARLAAAARSAEAPGSIGAPKTQVIASASAKSSAREGKSRRRVHVAAKAQPKSSGKSAKETKRGSRKSGVRVADAGK